jgi:hypothetical protein
MSEAKHPNEANLLGFVKSIKTLEYCEQLAAWVNQNYPASTDTLLPKIREQYKAIKRGEREG